MTGSNIFGAILAFLIGVLIASGSYVLLRYVLQKKPDKYAMAQMGKQVIQILYLVALYAFGRYTPWDELWLLVGGCLGITLPMPWFTYRLVKLNESLHRKEDAADG